MNSSYRGSVQSHGLYLETTFQSQEVRPNPRSRVSVGYKACLKKTHSKKLFMSPHNKFNMADEVESARVILINTKRVLLGAHGCQLFGRFFFLSQLMQAALLRGPRSMPVLLLC